MDIIKKLILKYREKMDEHIAISVETCKLHEKTFLPYKNYCKGKGSVVICGAGPSLQDYQPIPDAVHIAVNRAFLYDKVKFDFIFAQDFDGIRMVQEELARYLPGNCVKFLAQTTIQNSKTIPETLALRSKALRFNCDYYIYGSGFKSKMVFDLENRALGGMPNVGMSVMQLALYMNPSRLYIVGCDMSGGHFAKGNQNDEELRKEKELMLRAWKKDQKRLLEKWKEIRDFAEIYYPDVHIISINPVGLKGIFEDIYQK